MLLSGFFDLFLDILELFLLFFDDNFKLINFFEILVIIQLSNFKMNLLDF